MISTTQSLANWFIALPAIGQATLVVGLISAFITAMSAIAAVANATVSRRQAATSEQALFASLLEKRIHWQREFRDAVKARNDEINKIPSASNPYSETTFTEPVALFAVSEAVRTASWLFDNTVSGKAKVVEDLLDRKTKLIIDARSGEKRNISAAQQASEVAWQIEEAMGVLIRSLKPFMYVGDVKRSIRAAKAQPKLKWVGRIN